MAGMEEMEEMQEIELPRAFWAIELVPGKEYSTVLPFDLHITSAVLPASAKDTGRSVVTVTFEEEEEKEKSFSIVSLNLNTHDSQSLDVVLDEDSQIKLSVSGKNPVHLSGYYVNENPDEGDMFDDDDEEIDSDEFGNDELMGEEDSEEDDVDDDIDAETMRIAAQVQDKKRKAQQANGEAKKPKTEQAQPKKENKPATPAGNPQQQKPQQQKTPQQQQQKAPQQQKPAQQQPQQTVLPNGLKYTILKEGTGPVATKGKKVGVKYVGKLTKNGKMFDASQKPFVFNLGAREVITGWDIGVAGMKVGEKRQLIIPPELGYGARGAGKDIPPNSTLTFDVELLHVK